METGQYGSQGLAAALNPQVHAGGTKVCVDRTQFESMVTELTRGVREPTIAYIGGNIRDGSMAIQRMVRPEQELHRHDGPIVTDSGHVLALYEFEKEEYDPIGVALYEGALELGNIDRIMERAQKKFLRVYEGIVEAPAVNMIITNRNLPTLRVPHTFSVDPEDAFFVDYQG